jgi:hypothetical protein
MPNEDLKKEIIKAGRIAIKELIKVAKEEIIGSIDAEDSLSADKLKSAAQAKRIAIEDSFSILQRIEEEESRMSTASVPDNIKSNEGFAERKSR